MPTCRRAAARGRAPLAAIYRRARTRECVSSATCVTSIERFRQAAEAMPDGIVVLDARSRIDWANPRALAQLGLDLAHDVGQPIVNLVRQPEFLRYLEAGDYGDVDRRAVESRRAAARSRCSSCRSPSTRSC